MRNTIIFRDYETGSKKASTTQPVQLCAIAIDPVKFEIKPNGIWRSYIRAVEDPEECERLGIDPVTDEALEINGITWDQIRSAPSLDVVWADHVRFIKSFYTGNSNWDAPVRAGFNIKNFDNKIDDRLCKLFGQWDSVWDTQKLFHPIHFIDTLDDVYRWTYRNNPRSISMDSIRQMFSIDNTMSHNAVKDCLDGVMLTIKFFKLYNHFTTKVKWDNSFEEENVIIKQLLQKYTKDE